MIDKDRMSDIPPKSETSDGSQRDPKTLDDHEHKPSRERQDDSNDRHWQKADPDLYPPENPGLANNSDMSDLHALLASMPAAEALDFAIDYLGADLSSDMAPSADSWSYDDFA
jgi:hypothetical protein